MEGNFIISRNGLVLTIDGNPIYELQFEHGFRKALKAAKVNGVAFAKKDSTANKKASHFSSEPSGAFKMRLRADRDLLPHFAIKIIQFETC